jgi:hypothetical protein
LGYLPDPGYLPDSDGPVTPPLLSDDSDTSHYFDPSSDSDTDRSDSNALSDSYFDSTAGSSSGTFHQDFAPVSVAPQSHDDPPSTSGAPQSNDPQPGSEARPLLDEPTPASEAVQLHNDLLPGSGNQPLHDGMHPVTEIKQEADDEVKSKGLCGLFRCWDWHVSRSFEWSRERIMGTVSPGAYVSAPFPPSPPDI